MANVSKKVLTQRQLDKLREKSKYDIDDFKGFISSKNMSSFGHICDSCIHKHDCVKRLGAIILKCDDFKRRYKREYTR